MALIVNSEMPMFDTSEIAKGDLLNGRFYLWNESMNMLVVNVKKDAIIAVYLPKIHSATCYIRIQAADVHEGKWQLRYSSDLSDVKEVSMTYGTDNNEGSIDSEEAVGLQ